MPAETYSQSELVDVAQVLDLIWTPQPAQNSRLHPT
jgi:hypothetical protein